MKFNTVLDRRNFPTNNLGAEYFFHVTTNVNNKLQFHTILLGVVYGFRPDLNSFDKIGWPKKHNIIYNVNT